MGAITMSGLPPLMHQVEAENPLRTKYGVESWQSYKNGSRTSYPGEPIREIAQSLVYISEMLHRTPRYIVLGRPLLEKFVALKIEIPKELENIPITYDLSQPFKVTFLL